jgi:hypothetical protein
LGDLESFEKEFSVFFLYSRYAQIATFSLGALKTSSKADTAMARSLIVIELIFSVWTCTFYFLYLLMETRKSLLGPQNFESFGEFDLRMSHG